MTMQDLISTQDLTPNVVLDGYISVTIGPEAAEAYFARLLRASPEVFTRTNPDHDWPDTVFVTHAPFPNTRSLSENTGSELWVIDYLVPWQAGTVVPQRLWDPPYRTRSPLEPPVFFVQRDGSVGLRLSDMSDDVLQSLRRADEPAPLGDGRTALIYLAWPGMRDWTSRINIAVKKQGGGSSPISLGKLAHLMGETVRDFLEEAMAKPTEQSDPGWTIGGPLGVKEEDVTLVGAINVSAGRWMPIIQLSRHIMYLWDDSQVSALPSCSINV